MKLALLSDIHANRQALDACLAHAEAAGAVADPSYVVQRVMAFAAQGAIVIQGNHDLYATQAVGDGKSLGHASVAWTQQQLSEDERAFLAALPLTAIDGSALLVHASAEAPENWRYVDNEIVAAECLEAATKHPGVKHVFCGHVHQQTLYYRGTGRGLMRFTPTAGVPVPVPPHRQWVGTVGSVGQPRDGDPRAMYALLDTDHWHLRFERVPYAVADAAAAILATGGALPASFAHRLEVGR